MNSPNDPGHNAAPRPSPGPPNPDDKMPKPQKPDWLKVLIIIFVGIPLGAVGLAVLVLGVCLLGGR